MNDSNERDTLTTKHERIEQQRLDAIERWVAYIRDNPPEVWGKQQNALVDSQLKSARESGLDAEHYRRIRRSRPED